MAKKTEEVLEHSKMLSDWKDFVPNNARILILGSFPSKCSERMNFYYASCTNAFWREYLGAEKIPDTRSEAIEICKKNKVALYDVIEKATFKKNRTCEDPKIKSIDDYATDQIDEILREHSKINDIFIMSVYASGIFRRHIKNKLKCLEGKNVHYNLPSSSRNFLRSGKSRENNKVFKKLKQCLKNFASE